MKYTLRQPIGYSEIGRKKRQEDAVYPLFDAVTADERVFVLCDGVGGSAHGDIASTTSSKIIQTFLAEQLQKNDYVTQEDMAKSVEMAYDALDKIDTKDSDCSMATTLTCIAMHKDGVLAAHMGDSRIYQVRPGKGVMYQSSDHSLVNALLQAGELTPEEAENFPRKNVIIRAIQPNTKRMHAEMHLLTDVQTGDYFFLCCDGVLEQLTNKRLVEILEMDCPDAEKLKLLEAESTGRTRDNYTAYLIPIAEVEGVSSIVEEDEIEVTGIADEETEAEETRDVEPQNSEATVASIGNSSRKPTQAPVIPTPSKGNATENGREKPATGRQKSEIVRQKSANDRQPEAKGQRQATGKPDKKSNKLLYVILALLVVIVAGLAYILFTQKKEQPTPPEEPQKKEQPVEPKTKTPEEAKQDWDKAKEAFDKAKGDFEATQKSFGTEKRKYETALNTCKNWKNSKADATKLKAALDAYTVATNKMDSLLGVYSDATTAFKLANDLAVDAKAKVNSETAETDIETANKAIVEATTDRNNAFSAIKEVETQLEEKTAPSSSVTASGKGGQKEEPSIVSEVKGKMQGVANGNK